MTKFRSEVRRGHPSSCRPFTSRGCAVTRLVIDATDRSPADRFRRSASERGRGRLDRASPTSVGNIVIGLRADLLRVGAAPRRGWFLVSDPKQDAAARRDLPPAHYCHSSLPGSEGTPTFRRECAGIVHELSTHCHPVITGFDKVASGLEFECSAGLCPAFPRRAGLESRDRGPRYVKGLRLQRNGQRQDARTTCRRAFHSAGIDYWYRICSGGHTDSDYGVGENE